MNKHLNPALGHRKLKGLTRVEIRRLYNEKSKAFSARSVDYIHAPLQMSLSQAVRDNLIPRNVALGERSRSSRNRKEAKALSPTQVKALLTAGCGTRNEVLYAVAVHTGLRQGELLGLKWTDTDLGAGKLSVRRSLKVTEDSLAFGPPKNKASRRSVPLNKSAVTALRAHRLLLQGKEQTHDDKENILSGADLRAAHNLTQKQIASATENESTKLPDGLQRPGSRSKNS